MNSKAGGYIASRSNGKVKLVQSLNLRKHRQKERLFVIDGIRFVRDAYQTAGKDAFDFVMFSDDTGEDADIRGLSSELMEGGVLVYETTSELMELMSDTKTPQGILGVMKMDSMDSDIVRLFELGLKGDDAKVLVLDRLQDPGNLGTIIRTADGAGFDGVILLKGTVDVFNPKVLRSTMGSVFNLPIVTTEWDEASSLLRDAGFEIVGAALERSIDYRDCDYSGRKALVIGNEGSGICRTVLDGCDTVVKIPIYGKAESLNASIAAGILMYKLVEGRSK